MSLPSCYCYTLSWIRFLLKEKGWWVDESEETKTKGARNMSQSAEKACRMKQSQRKDLPHLLIQTNSINTNHQMHSERFPIPLPTRNFIICVTDKDLGPAIIECDGYILHCLKDHPFHTETYQQLLPDEASKQRKNAIKRLGYLYERVPTTALWARTSNEVSSLTWTTV